MSFTTTTCAQNSHTDIVNTDGIVYPVHKANIGKITFFDRTVRITEYSEKDFLTAFEIAENKNLDAYVFMGNSLTNYLHKLDTSLSAEELTAKGNFQFSFYVDGKLVYTENLNPRAGWPSDKNEVTLLKLPLLSTANPDYWSRFLWARFFFYRGGEEVLTPGRHTFKLEMRSYLDHDGIKVGELIAEGEIDLIIPEPEPATEEQMAVQVIAPGSDWKLSDDRIDESKIRQLNKDIIERQFKNVTSIVVIKDGELLLEEYFNDADRNTLHDTRSVGKSFAATMAGIAIDEGHLKSINQTLSEFYNLSEFENYSPTKDKVTIESLMTMSSGFDANDSDPDSPGNENNMYPTDNWVKFALDLKMDPAKELGKNFDYFTAGVVVLGDIVDKSVPGGLEKYADKKLFKPLGISKYQWPYTPQGVAGTAGGLQMSALDFARYGQLYKNKGLWGDQRILTRKWVNQSLSNHFEENKKETAYGYLFWNHIYSSNGKNYEVFQASGNGGNKIIMFKDQPLVIVITATAYGRPFAHPQAHQIVEEYLLPAIMK